MGAAATHASLAAFDAPGRETCTVRESRTNTPLQALVMMNDPTFVEAAQALAMRVMHDGGKTPEETIAMIRKAKLVPPSEHQESIPQEMDDVVMRMLERHQEDRYERISHVLSELDTIAEEQEVEA